MPSVLTVGSTRVVETVVPARLGRPFRRLLVASVVTNAGDGVALAAGPLLVASQTRDPLLVSMAALSQFLPVLLFGFVAGAVVDRFDRRRIVVLVNLARAAVLAVLAATIVAGAVNIGVVLGALFVLGTAETFADVGSSTLLPRLVRHEDLGVANARMQGAFLLTNQLLTPPIGAFLFAVGIALPFATNALCFALGALLVWRIAMPAARDGAGNGGRAGTRAATDAARAGTVAATPADGAGARAAADAGLATDGRATDAGRAATDGGADPGRPRSSLRADIVEGLRWLLAHPPMRTLALTIVAFNVTYGAAWSVLVLYAGERLGMNAVGFGLLTTAIAVGGIAGTLSYGSLERRFSLANIMRVGLLIETGTHLSLALTTSPVVALGTMVVFGAHAFVWGTTSTVVRQRAVPDELLGRVTAVYQVGLVGGIVVGTPIGGLLARGWGITGPFWFGFVGSAVLVAVLWRQFEHIVHASEASDGGRHAVSPVR